MKAVGIICEYNPFHYGHVYHINKVKEMFPDYTIVLVLSGNYVQRGGISLIDKWDKTAIALNYVDLVVELPFAFASQSADVFAKGAINILNYLNVEKVIFGTESLDVGDFKKISLCQSSSNFIDLMTNYLDKGFNYPSAMSKAVLSLTGINVNKPNDLLGLSYVKEINRINSPLEPICIKRTNDYHDTSLKDKIVSASAIRKGIINGEDITKFVSQEVIPYLDNMHSTEDYFSFIKYKIISSNINNIQSVDEGIENRIYKYINTATSLEELVNLVKTKRYTYNKLMRMFIHILTNFTKEEASKTNEIKYIRVLGFNNLGKKYLNYTKKIISIPIISKYNENLYLES